MVEEIKAGDTIQDKLSGNKYVVLEVKKGIIHDILTGIGGEEGDLKVKRTDGVIGTKFSAEVKKI